MDWAAISAMLFIRPFGTYGTYIFALYPDFIRA